MAKTKKKKKRTKVNKVKTRQSSKPKDDRIFNFILISIGVFFVVGIVFTAVLAVNQKPAASNKNSASQGVINYELNNGKLHSKLLSLGFTRTVYDPSKPQEAMFYIEPREWSKFSFQEQQKRFTAAAEAWKQLIIKQFGDASKAYLMFHTPDDRMIATWDPRSGVRIQR
jgi:hypothetical protein